MYPEVEERLSSVESALAEFIIQTNKLYRKGERETEAFRNEMKAFRDEMKIAREQSDREMREFKDEMKEFKDEMREFKDEMKEFKDEMKEFKDEMKEFKDEMSKFKEEAIKDRREMNKKWGEITNKLGTFAEDVAYPNIPRIAAEMFGCKNIQFKGVRIDAKDPNDSEFLAEFDAIVIADDTIFLLESKFTYRMKEIEKLPEIIERFRRCFPEHKGKHLVPIFASMSIPDNIVKYVSKIGYYAMAMGDDTMDIVNFDAVKKRFTV